MKKIFTKEEIEKHTFNGLLKMLNKEIVYRYIDYENGLKFLLTDNSLKFKLPEEFNDPFDCNENLISFSIKKEDIKNQLKTNYIALNRSQRRETERECLKSENLQKTFFKERKRDYKIYSFSETYKDVLMWSHYADKHKGLCIGLKLPIINKPYYNLYPANYLPEIIPIDGNVDLERAIYYWLTSKSECWEYEKEVRAISTFADDVIHFDKDCVKEVFIGCKRDKKQDLQFLKELKGLKYDSLKVKKMEIDANTFLLKETILKF